ncbi:MAG TPA: proline--tRNA ligase [Burkholderiales bacterium]|nr:proline--tRNA ligase [Burkholderiales bacterium]
MRASQFFISTLKEAPAEAELVSHKLMLRAGLIRKLGSGLYSWMPLGLRVLRKVEGVVREEMNKAGGLEVLMPAIQPAELWQETGRWDIFGPLMLRIKDRHERDFCFGPTHEEVITDIARKELRSYRQLPVNLYQIQMKFRDEIRPRFGVMRAREFLMKDAYSFDADKDGLKQSYQAMYDAYTRIFTRLGLKFRAVAADTGAIGGSASHEFQVLADSGEDAIAYCPDSDYAANVELAEAVAPTAPRSLGTKPLQVTPTPGKRTCEEVAEFLSISLEQTVKSVIRVSAGKMYMFLIRGDHELNEVKAAKLGTADDFRPATEEEIEATIGCKPGYIGPVGLDKTGVVIVADRTVAAMSDFVCGANKAEHHITGVNWDRDLPEPQQVADIRNVVEGDRSPDGKGNLKMARGIEVGHVFALGAKYSEAMGANYIDESGQARPMEMGCYGIGVSRVVAAAIEQNHDERGINFPRALAPFDVAIIPVGYGKSEAVREAADQLHAELTAAGLDVLLDDRDERMGVMLADQELIGVPHRVVIGERALKNGQIEYQSRSEKAATLVTLQGASEILKSKICA